MAVRNSARVRLGRIGSHVSGPHHAIAVAIKKRVPTEVSFDRKVSTECCGSWPEALPEDREYRCRTTPNCTRSEQSE